MHILQVAIGPMMVFPYPMDRMMVFTYPMDPMMVFPYPMDRMMVFPYPMDCMMVFPYHMDPMMVFPYPMDPVMSFLIPYIWLYSLPVACSPVSHPAVLSSCSSFLLFWLLPCLVDMMNLYQYCVSARALHEWTVHSLHIAPAVTSISL